MTGAQVNIIGQATSQWAAAALSIALGSAAMERTFFHRPVMVREVLDLLGVRPGGSYIDATVGEGGHASAILEVAMPGGRLLGLDLDPHALEAARARLAQWQGSFTLVHSSYAEMEDAAAPHGFANPDGILLDVGLSSFQLQASGRGFTFQRDEPLDMRYDPEEGLTAAQVVNSYSMEQLARLISRYGEEPRARAVARSIVQHRPLVTTGQLADVVASTTGRRRGRIHPATRTFQALRIVVNGELESLGRGLQQALEVMRPGGRVAVISYHSLEDRIVKETFARESKGCLCPPGTPTCVCGHVPTVQILTRRPVRPSPEEVVRNPRSRSARLRVAQRLLREQ